MDKDAPDWNLYRCFVEVVRDGSLSGAARRLGIAQPTAGRQIDALEAALGVTLFTRSPRGLLATAAARELLPHAQAMAAAAQALRRAASGETRAERGTVRLAASEIVGAEVLPPLLADFRDRHPDIAIELTLSNRNEDLLRRDADIAVRMARPSQKALVSRRIGQVRVGLFAHRRYALAHGLPQSAEQVGEFALIGFDRDDFSFRSVGPPADQITREQFSFRCDNDLAQLAALRAGVGIGACHVGIARRDPELVPVLPRLTFQLGMWLAMHEDLRGTRRVKLLFDALGAGLRRHVEASG